MRAGTAGPHRAARLPLTGLLTGCCLAMAACGAPSTVTAPPVAPGSATPSVSTSEAPISPSAVSTPSRTPPSTQRSTSSAAPSSTSTPTPRPQTVRCADLVSSLSLRDRVGQLMMVAVASDGVGAAAATAIDESRAGSVILLGNTTAGAARVSAVVEQARSAARTPKEIKTMVAADQEGGQVQRLRGQGFDRIPSAQRQAETSPAELKSDAARWGRQLRRVGIDANLAPVADVVPKGREGTNEPIGVLRRGYGSNPAAAARHVTAFVEGMDAAGVATSVKHFPGLGRVRGNTDLTAEVVDSSTTRRDPDLKPFVAGVEAGTDMVMMSSAYYAEIDPSRRAAFSPTVIKGMVRGDLGFTGVVISDDLAAAAMRDLNPGQRMLRFLRAGGDLAIVGDAGLAARMADTVVDEARDDPKLAAAVEASTLRVLQLKDRRGLADC